MKVNAIVSWFGQARMVSEKVGQLLKGCSWVGVPFAGSMCELKDIDARTMLVSDLHRHVINLASVIANPNLRPELVRQLQATPFHADVLERAQAYCLDREANVPETYPWLLGGNAEDRIMWALHFFVCSWMARNATSGTNNEFDAPLSVRWNAAGGDSVVRFRNATEGLEEWSEIMRRCTFVCLDFFDFMEKVKDEEGHGVYCDPPFPGPGDAYKHQFGEKELRRMTTVLGGLKKCKVVCRFYDHPLVHEMYPEPKWTWHRFTGRKQSNADAPEVLVCNWNENTKLF